VEAQALLDSGTEVCEWTSRWEPPAECGEPRRRRGDQPHPRTRLDEYLTASPAEASDEELFDRLRRGDTAAGETLVGRHYEPLLRYLHRIAGPRAAEDLLQQTWLSVLAHADRFVAGADHGSFKGWLFRIATNKTKDHWRSTTREKAAKEGYRRLTDGESAPWAGHVANGADQEEKLRRALEALPDGQRAVLLLRYYSDMKFADIASVLGCPVNTALTRAHKGLLKLRDAMNGRPAARESAGDLR